MHVERDITVLRGARRRRLVLRVLTGKHKDMFYTEVLKHKDMF